MHTRLCMAKRFAACGEAPDEPPVGFVYAPSCPPLVLLTDKKALVGKKVLTARINNEACGVRLVRRHGHQGGREQEGQGAGANRNTCRRVQAEGDLKETHNRALVGH